MAALRRALKLEVVVLDGFILFICIRIDVEKVERFDERHEFLIAEIPHIEIGELLTQ